MALGIELTYGDIMRSIAFKRVVVVVCGFVVFSAAAHADDQPASRFLYCANVAQFYYQYLLKNNPSSPDINTYKITRDNFRMAAAATKAFPDNAAFVSENNAALNKVIAVLQKEKSENSRLMDGENRSCAETMTKEAIPLLIAKTEKQN